MKTPMIQTTVGPVPSSFIRWLRAKAPGRAMAFYPAESSRCPVARWLHDLSGRDFCVAQDRMRGVVIEFGFCGSKHPAPAWVQRFVKQFDAAFDPRRLGARATDGRRFCFADEILKWLGLPLVEPEPAVRKPVVCKPRRELAEVGAR